MEKEKKGFMINLALIVLIMLLSAILKVSFWYLLFAGLIFILLRYIGIKAVTNAVIILLFVVLAPIVTKSFMPEVHAALTPTRERTGQVIAGLLPSEFDVDVNNIFNEEKKAAGEVFKTWYKAMLSQDRIVEAKDSLLAFEKKWGPLKKEKEETVVVEEEVPISHRVIIPERVYPMGEYKIVVEKETPFYIVINFKRDVKKGFRFKSESNNFMLILEDGSIVKTDAELPYRDVYRIRLKTTLPKEVVTLRVY